MQKGHSMDLRKSRDYFRWTSDLTHKFNNQVRPMRGGYRL